LFTIGDDAEDAAHREPQGGGVGYKEDDSLKNTHSVRGTRGVTFDYASRATQRFIHDLPATSA